MIVTIHVRFLGLSHLDQIFLFKLICLVLVIHRLVWFSSDCGGALMLSVCIFGGRRDCWWWLLNYLRVCTILALCCGSFPCCNLFWTGALTYDTEGLIFKVASCHCLSLWLLRRDKVDRLFILALVILLSHCSLALRVQSPFLIGYCKAFLAWALSHTWVGSGTSIDALAVNRTCLVYLFLILDSRSLRMWWVVLL